MSQIHEALNKVKQEREKRGGPLSGQPRPMSLGINYAVISVLLLFVAIGSIWVNMKTLAELQNTRGISQTMAQHLDDQKKELLAMSRYWKQEAQEKKAQMASLQQEVQEIKIAFAKVEDLKTNNRLLLDKFIALNDKVQKLGQPSQVNDK